MNTTPASRKEDRPDGKTPDPRPPGTGQRKSATDEQPSGIDMGSESAAGEEDPGAAIDAPPAKG